MILLLTNVVLDTHSGAKEMIFQQEIARNGLTQFDGDFKLDERMKVGHITASREWPTRGRWVND